MKQPERSNANLSWSKVNARRLNFDRAARMYAALAALLLVFVFSLSNATGASGPQANQPNARQGEVVLDGIRYSPITDDKGQTIYVPTIATPEYIAKTIEENLGHIKNEINWDLIRIYEEEPIEELTIEPNLEQRLEDYYRLMARHDGNAIPSEKELKTLIRKYGYPVLLSRNTFHVIKIGTITYLTPLGESEDAYLVGIKEKEIKRGPRFSVEGIIRMQTRDWIKPEKIRTDTTERTLGYSRYSKRIEEKRGIGNLAATGELRELETFQKRNVKGDIMLRFAVQRNPKSPKEATLLIFPPAGTLYNVGW